MMKTCCIYDEHENEGCLGDAGADEDEHVDGNAYGDETGDGSCNDHSYGHEDANDDDMPSVLTPEECALLK